MIAVLRQPTGTIIPIVKAIRLDEAVATVVPLLRVTLGGQMRAEDASGHSVLPRSRKTRAVLAVLALAAPEPVLRTKLTGLLWSRRGREQARGSLRQSVHELQRALGSDAACLLQADRNHLSLSNDRLHVDLAAVGTPPAGSVGREVLRSVLLEDLEGLDPAFDAWLAEQRQQVAQLTLSRAEVRLAAATDVAARIEAAERVLAIERTHQEAWRVVIGGYLELGNHTAARLAFERCAVYLSGAGRVPVEDIQGLFRTAPLAPKGLRPLTAGKGVRLRVLPLRVLDRSGTDGLLAGLAEEITAAISRFRWISCLAEPVPEPAADYILDSTQQCSGNRVRIIVRLLDVQAGSDVVWARRFDREIIDALVLQGDLAAEISAQIDPELLLREGERRGYRDPQEANAFDLTLRAIPAIYRLEPARFHAAGDLLCMAAGMEPGNASAHAWWAYWNLFLVGQAWAEDPAGATARAGELAERAVTLDPCDARALALVGHVRSFLHKRAEEACVLLERALSLNPNLPLAWCFSGLAHCYRGDYEIAIEHITRAQHLSPHDPHAFFFDMALMMPHFLMGSLDQAMTLGRRALELNPGFSSTYKGYLATLGRLGHEREARRILTRLLALEPGFSVRNAVERSPMMQPADRDLYADGLRKAGLPED